MSTYATMQGTVTCPDYEDFDALRKQLRDSEFIGQFGNWSCQCPVRPSVLASDALTRTFTLPFAYYRNLCYVNFFAGTQRKGRIIGTSTDGVFVGWVETPDGCVEVGLSAYAEGPAPDIETETRAYAEWQRRAEEKFHAERSQPPTHEQTPCES